MPYSSNAELPKAVKNALPESAQTVFRNAYNNSDGDDEETLMRKAWAAVRNAGFEKRGDNWVKVNKAEELEVVVEEDHRLVFGFASVAIHKGEQVLDHHNDLLDVEDLEKAGYVYNLESRAGNDMHDGPDVMQLVESVVITDEKIAKWAEAYADEGTEDYTEALTALQKYLPRALWVGYYVDDDNAWDAVKKGERRMFSIEGEAIRESVDA